MVEEETGVTLVTCSEENLLTVRSCYISDGVGEAGGITTLLYKGGGRGLDLTLYE